MRSANETSKPSQLLEHIRYWKQQENEHAGIILQAAPGLETEYAQLIQSWQPLFVHTAKFAASWLDKEELKADRSAYEEPDEQIDALLLAASQQSQNFVNQLSQLMLNSQAVGHNPVAKVVIDHAVRESHDYLAIAQSFKLTPSNTEEDDERAPTSQVPIGGHKLPPLPYPYNALEPHIDEKTMRIHHDIHHQSYVDGLNKAELELQKSRQSGNFDLVKHWERELAFHGAGHYLHTIFWFTMSPSGGGEPTGNLVEQIKQDFGSYEAFKKQFSEAAGKVEGGGWAILVWSPRSRRLEILTAEKHQNLSQWDVVPLLTLDVWEHAYYLKHQNKRADYIKDWWNVVYWPAVIERYNKASKLTWSPF